MAGVGWGAEGHKLSTDRQIVLAQSDCTRRPVRRLKTLAEAPLGPSPCLETWSVCLGKGYHSASCPGRGDKKGTDGDRARRCKEKGDLCREWGRLEKQLEDEHVGYEIRKQLL